MMGARKSAQRFKEKTIMSKIMIANTMKITITSILKWRKVSMVKIILQLTTMVNMMFQITRSNYI